MRKCNVGCFLESRRGEVELNSRCYMTFHLGFVSNFFFCFIPSVSFLEFNQRSYSVPVHELCEKCSLVCFHDHIDFSSECMHRKTPAMNWFKHKLS